MIVDDALTRVLADWLGSVVNNLDSDRAALLSRAVTTGGDLIITANLTQGWVCLDADLTNDTCIELYRTDISRLTLRPPISVPVPA